MPLSVLKDLRKIYAGLNADEIRGSAHQDIKVGLMADSERDYSRLEEFLAPAGIDSYTRLQALRNIHRMGGEPHTRFDVVLCGEGVPVPANGYVLDPQNPGRTAAKILADHDEIDLALSRNFPLFRKPLADKIISRVARENALFSIVTALPNVVPSLVELPWAVGEFATDTAFLTMNQIRMALTLAAASDRPVGYMEQKAEIGVIVAGAFGWRAIARELIGKIPLGGGLIPKAAVAFAGTYVVGLGLEKINRTGFGLSKREKQDAYADAFAKGKEVVKDLAPQVGFRS